VPRPRAEAWVAAVHAGERDPRPLGSAVVVAPRQVLTSAHVILSAGEVQEPLWVSFPGSAGAGRNAGRNAGTDERRRVTSVAAAYAPPATDLAMLVLDGDVPSGAEPAPLRCPRPADLVGLAWRAFGFPDRDPLGRAAQGVVGAPLAHGWVRLDSPSPHLGRPGFGGGGLWSPDYQAVVGVVGQAQGDGDGRAITLGQAAMSLPDQDLERLTAWSARAAGETALAAWGASPDPRYRFVGRGRALTRISHWLDRPVADRRVLVVTGSPGAGKSAVLGRAVATSDAGLRARLPRDDDAAAASPGAVTCAVHARAKTAQEVATEIARAASAGLPDRAADLARAVRDALGDRGSPRFNVIIDGLDEAVSPQQGRAIISAIVLPLAQTCADVGVQVIVGTRHHDDQGSLVTPFGDAVIVINLNDPEYFAEDDLAAHALSRLSQASGERPGHPYADAADAVPVARRIAALSDRNFLIAGLVARGRGLQDEQAADPGELKFDATVDAALAGYAEADGSLSGPLAGQALTALAFAQAPGWPVALWQLAVESLYGNRIPAADLVGFARSPMADFLVGSVTDRSGQPVFGLFHQACGDALTRARAETVDRRDDEEALTVAFTGYGRRDGWENVPEYLTRSLPGHAAAAGLVDDLLADDTYLLRADVRRLMLAGRAAPPAASRRVRMLELTPEAIPAGSGERAALFSVTEALDGIESRYDRRSGAPYLARWARAQPRAGRAPSEDRLDAAEGHQDWVRAVGPVTVHGREMLATAGDDWTVRIWDPATGEQQAVLEGHEDWVRALCAVGAAGRQLLATAGDDRTVRIWDPATGEERAVLDGHRGGVGALCPVTVTGQQLLASAGTDRTVRIWDPATGEQHAVLRGHQGSVVGVCPATVKGQPLLASAGTDRTVRIWDPATGEQRGVLRGHRGGVSAVCPVTVDGRDLLVSAGGDNTVRIWDTGTGEQRAVLRGHQDWVTSVAPVIRHGRDRLASASRDATVRIWDPAAGTGVLTIPTHHPALTAVPVDGLLAIGLVAGVLVLDLNLGA
jgi:Trypsin-like peptidase domain/WD domain, G-beta repeat